MGLEGESFIDHIASNSSLGISNEKNYLKLVRYGLFDQDELICRVRPDPYGLPQPGPCSWDESELSADTARVCSVESDQVFAEV